MRVSYVLFAAGIAMLASASSAQQAPANQPYKVLKSEKVGGAGGFDYVYADSDGRKLYIARSAGGGRGGRNGGGAGAAAGGAGAPAVNTASRVDVYDLDTLKLLGNIPDANGVHGAAVDTKSHHGFCSSQPVVMWDTETLKTIKSIPVQGNPDGIFSDPATQRIFVLSHSAPNVTVLNAVDGSIAGTIDLGGMPEEGVSDGQGHVYIDVESGDNVAAVDANTLKVTAHYPLNGKGGGPAGLAMDAKNHILFAMCHNPQTCVILSAEDGKILDTLPIGNGVDAAEFNPNTMEAFSSQGDGTLTVIKENSPTSFVVEQTVQTKQGAKCSTLDMKTNQILLTTVERVAAATQPATQPAPQGQAAQGQPADQGGRGGNRGGRGGGRGGATVPDSFTIIVVGK